MGFYQLRVRAGRPPMMSTGKFGSGSLKRDSSQPDMTGLLEREQYNPGDEQRAGTLTTQQCAEQLRGSLLRETWGPTVSKAGDATVQARGQRRFGAVTSCG